MADKNKGGKTFDLQEVLESVNNLDMENVGGWPMPIKVVVATLLLIAVLVGAYMLSIQPLNENLTRLQKQEVTLMQSYKLKAYRAKSLDQYKQQLADMKKEFGNLLSKLPKDTEVPGLLEDITHTGEGSGLQIKKIALGSEVRKKFYAELPIHIEVVGGYHGFGNFVSGVAALSRIVTLHDFSIKPTGKGGKLLAMTISAETYSYVGDDEGGQK